MAHHKRRRPKHQRAGCLLCKPHKDERLKGKRDVDPPSERRRKEAAELKMKERDE